MSYFSNVMIAVTKKDFEKIENEQKKIKKNILLEDLDVDNYKENVVAIKEHSISAHQTKACKDYTGEDAEVWVFDCGGAF